MEILVDEYVYSEDGSTRIRLSLGNGCFLSFVIQDRVKVPKYIKFVAPLETCEDGLH